MNYKKIEEQIRKFHFICLANESMIDQLNDVLGIKPEGKFFENQYEIITGYVSALDFACGVGEWLEWWLFECHLGKNKLSARLPDEKERSIEYLDDFVKLVIDDLKMSEK